MLTTITLTISAPRVRRGRRNRRPTAHTHTPVIPIATYAATRPIPPPTLRCRWAKLTNETNGTSAYSIVTSISRAAGAARAKRRSHATPTAVESSTASVT